MKEARINESRLKIATDSSKESVSKKDFPRIFRRCSANQAMEDAANMPIPNMLFGEFIFEEELTVLYTKPNVGKSLLAMHITEMIATGTGLEGLKNESEPQKVIYVDLELSDQQRRIRYSEEIINPKTGKREYYNAYNFHKNVIIVDYNYEEIPKRYDRLEVIFKNIEAEFEETGAKVMVIDNISWLTMKGLERSDHAKELMSKLANLVKNKKYGMLVVAHTPKISENTPIELGHLSGSGTIGNAVDAAFIINDSYVQGHPYKYLKMTKARSCPKVYNSRNVLNITLDYIRPNFIGASIVEVDDDLKFEINHLNADVPMGTVVYDEQQKREAQLKIKRVLDEDPDISSRQLAKIIGVSHTTTIKYKKQVLDNPQLFDGYMNPKAEEDGDS